jgi:hypothetical protein
LMMLNMRMETGFPFGFLVFYIDHPLSKFEQCRKQNHYYCCAISENQNRNR